MNYTQTTLIEKLIKKSIELELVTPRKFMVDYLAVIGDKTFYGYAIKSNGVMYPVDCDTVLSIDTVALLTWVECSNIRPTIETLNPNSIYFFQRVQVELLRIRRNNGGLIDNDNQLIVDYLTVDNYEKYRTFAVHELNSFENSCKTSYCNVYDDEIHVFSIDD